jgi:hypothetical protein
MKDFARNEFGAIADWISLAAMPVFAVMALVTSVGGTPDMAMASPPGGMTAMYLLMRVFHAAPWLKRMSNRRSPSLHICQKET